MTILAEIIAQVREKHRTTNSFWVPLRQRDYHRCTCGHVMRFESDYPAHYDEMLLVAIQDTLKAEGYAIKLISPCRCGCGKSREKHLCPCGCGHTYEEAVRNVMGGPMFLSWEQAEANIDEHPNEPCRWD